jgi:uncharacterized membrane protein YfcA
MKIAFLLALGLLAGLASSVLGIGGGVVLVPGFMLLAGIKELNDATATSLAYIFPVALAGALFRWHGGSEIRWLVVLMTVPAGILGTHLGGLIVRENILNPAQLKIIFAVLMVLVAVKLTADGTAELRAPTAGAETVHVTDDAHDTAP